MVASGESNYYLCKHFTEEGKEILLEKCCSPQSREPDIYELMDNYGLFKTNILLRTPELKGIIERKNYIKLFLSYERGIKLNKYPLEEIDFFKLGQSLGEIGVHFTPLMKDSEKIKDKPFNYFDAGYAYNVFEENGAIDEEEVKKLVAKVEDLFKYRKELISARKSLPSLFSHNDAGLQNILIQEDGNGAYVFLDWERAGFNCAGSDIGNVLGLLKETVLKNKRDLEEFERQMVDGYLASLERSGYNVSREEVLFSYNLHFINSKINGAVAKRKLELFRRIAERCDWLKQFVS